ncbi:MAG: hypothetical protein AAF646_11890 [Pseudomonadota bacterium]
MAVDISRNPTHGVPSPLLWLIWPLDRLLAFFAAIEGANRAARRYERLATLTDTELAQHGLTREALPLAACREI